MTFRDWTAIILTLVLIALALGMTTAFASPWDVAKACHVKRQSDTSIPPVNCFCVSTRLVNVYGAKTATEYASLMRASSISYAASVREARRLGKNKPEGWKKWGLAGKRRITQAFMPCLLRDRSDS